MDANHLSDGTDLLICTCFLASNAEESYENKLDLRSDQGEFTSWPQAVKFLLHTYTKDTYIDEALERVDEPRQDSEKQSRMRNAYASKRKVAAQFSESRT